MNTVEFIKELNAKTEIELYGLINKEQDELKQLKKQEHQTYYDKKLKILETEYLYKIINTNSIWNDYLNVVLPAEKQSIETIKSIKEKIKELV